MSTHVERGEGRSFWLLRDRHTFKVTGDETNGAFTVAELTADAELGPPPHVHLHADESFYVLEGSSTSRWRARRSRPRLAPSSICPAASSTPIAPAAAPPLERW